MKLNYLCRLAPRFIWALLALTLLSPGAVPLTRAADNDYSGGVGAEADDELAEAKKAEAAAKVSAEAKVNAAKTPFEKIIAVYERSRLPEKMQAPDRADWTQAEADINEVVRLVAAFESDGKNKINGKAGNYFQQGYIANRLAKYQDAIAAYDLAEKTGYIKANAGADKKGSELLNNRGQAKSALYDYAGALADYDAALALYDGAQWRQNRAWAHYNLGDYDLAVSDWNAAIKLNSTTGKLPFDAELAPLNKAVANDPGSVGPLMARARFNFKKAEGANSFSFLVTGSPSEPANFIASALADLDRAVKIVPDSPAVLLDRGRMRLAYVPLKSDLDERQHPFDYAETTTDFLRVIELEPKNAEAWFELGKAHLVLWDREVGFPLAFFGQEKEKAAKSDAAMRRAIAAFSRAIYLQPDASGEAHFQRAGALRKLTGAQDPNALLADYSAAIAQNLSATDSEWDALLHSVPNEKRRVAALAEAHFTRARIFISYGQLVATLADYDAALLLQDNNLDGHFERGKLRVQRGDYAGALADFALLTKNKPAIAEGWLWQGVAHDGKGEAVEAAADFGAALKLDPKLSAYLAGSRYDAQNPNPARGVAPAPVTSDVKVLPPGTALEHKTAGNALRAKGDLDGALREYTLALIIDPDFADALNNRGNYYEIHDEVDLALADFNHAIASDPKHRIAYGVRGLLWRKLGESERERADFDQAIEFADTDERRSGALRNRAKTRERVKDVEGALADAQRATELTPKDTEAWWGLGTMQLNARRDADACVSYRRALAIDPSRVEIRTQLVVALALQKDETASSELDPALAMVKAPQLAVIRKILNQASLFCPDSLELKALKERADAANATE